MTSERWQQIEVLYHAALECEPGQRRSYLQHACGADAALRREIEGLLAHEEEAAGFIEEPALVIAAQELADAAPEPATGQTFGRYRILFSARRRRDGNGVRRAGFTTATHRGAQVPAAGVCGRPGGAGAVSPGSPCVIRVEPSEHL